MCAAAHGCGPRGHACSCRSEQASAVQKLCVKWATALLWHPKCPLSLESSSPGCVQLEEGGERHFLNCWILRCIAPELYHADYLYWLIIALLLFRLVANVPHVLHLAVAEGLGRNPSTDLDHDVLQELSDVILCFREGLTDKASDSCSHESTSSYLSALMRSVPML